jgi:hypothetical protein
MLFCDFITGSAEMHLHLIPVEPISLFLGENKATMKTLELISACFELRNLHFLVYLLAMRDETMGGIVGGQANRDSIPHDNPNFETLHFSTKTSTDSNTVFQ